jgi:hypothetical protein
MEHAPRLLVIRIGREHRADHAELVGDRREIRQQLAHLDAAPAVLRERESRRQQAGGRPLGAEIGGGRTLTGIFDQRRLRIPQIDLRGAAGHEQEDDALGSWREVRPDRVSRGSPRIAGQKIGQPEHADPAAQTLQHFASRECFYGQKITSLVESSACA